MNEKSHSEKVRNGRLKLLAILAIFIVPFIGANILFEQKREDGDVTLSSNGELIWPAVPLEDFSIDDSRNDETVDLGWLKQRWTLAYFPSGACGEVCEKNIYHMRQIHTALGKEAHRLQRLAVAGDVDSVGASVGNEYPGLLLVNGATSGADQLIGQFDSALREMPKQQDSMYLIDPLGNLMMRFSPDLDPKGVLKDIKRALRASQIG